jgi:hypothetical protein
MDNIGDEEPIHTMQITRYGSNAMCNCLEIDTMIMTILSEIPETYLAPKTKFPLKSGFGWR